jgi:hypothetical protein
LPAGCLPVPPSFTDALSISSQKHSNPLDPGSVWTNEEILNLIQVWSDLEVQVQFGQSYRNSTTYEKIVANMKLLGYGRTWQQCRNKIKLLKSEYYKVVKHGSKKKNYVYRELMDKVLGGNQQEMAEMVHDGSDTEVVEEFDNDTSVGSIIFFIYYEYLDKVLGEIQPKLYETEQDMRGKMEDKEVHKKNL